MSAMSGMIRGRVVVVNTDGLVETGHMPQRAHAARIATNHPVSVVSPEGGETRTKRTNQPKGNEMPRSTRSNPNRPDGDNSDKPDIPVKPEPETDESVTADVEPTTDSTPESDTSTTTDEPVIPSLPDNWVADHPLVAEAAELVIAAEARKDDPTPITDFVAAADKMFNVDTGFAVVEALEAGGISPQDAFATTEAFKALVDVAREARETVDREDGDNLLEALVKLVATPRGGIDSESDKTAIPILMARWRASAPKRAAGTGTPRTGESDIAALTYPDGRKLRVKFRCGTCGKTFSTRKDNLNSARNECIKHSRTHGANLSNGSQGFKEVTNGLFLTGLTFEGKTAKPDDLVDQIDRGGWRFTREAG
jgi:hypothetical protein